MKFPKFRMAEKSLFAILLRSPWWISLALAGVIALISRLALPTEMFWFGAMGGFPFLVIAVMAARRQMNEPSAARVQKTLEAAGAMSWRDFSAALEDGWLKAGFTVTRREGRDSGGADFAIHKSGATTLVAGKRWKAASLGVEPLRELKAALDKAEARDGIFVALGDVTPQAAKFARDSGIRVLQAPELVKLLRNTSLGGASRA
jgi:restriction system protein